MGKSWCKACRGGGWRVESVVGCRAPTRHTTTQPAPQTSHTHTCTGVNASVLLRPCAVDAPPPAASSLLRYFFSCLAFSLTCCGWCGVVVVCVCVCLFGGGCVEGPRGLCSCCTLLCTPHARAWPPRHPRCVRHTSALPPHLLLARDKAQAPAALLVDGAKAHHLVAIDVLILGHVEVKVHAVGRLAHLCCTFARVCEVP
jgi:hypothetical protein